MQLIALKYYIKMIHTLKYNYFPDDERRKVYLEGNYGVDSLTKLTIEQLREVLILVGWKPSNRATQDAGKATEKQVVAIESLWKEIARNKSQMALRNFINRIVGYRPLFLQQMARKDAQKVITALKKMREQSNDKQL